MVVAELIKNAPIEKEDANTYPVIEGLSVGQPVIIEHRYASRDEFSSDTVIIRKRSSVDSASQDRVIVRYDDQPKGTPEVILHDQIESGEIRVLADPDLFTPENQPFHPVATHTQVAFANFLGVSMARVMQMNLITGVLPIALRDSSES